MNGGESKSRASDSSLFAMVGRVDKGSGTVAPDGATPSAGAVCTEPDPSHMHRHFQIRFDTDTDRTYDHSMKRDVRS